MRMVHNKYEPCLFSGHGMWRNPEPNLRCEMCPTTLPQLPLSLSRFSLSPTNNCRASSLFLLNNGTNRGNGSLHLHPKSKLSAVKCSINGAAGAGDFPQAQDQHLQSQQSNGFWSKWKVNSAEMRSKLAKLGLAALLAYGLFDGVTYTSFFVLAFLGYEKSTGNNPAANLQALLGIVILMWTGNNITRPFRVAGAAALAPIIDKGLRKIQKHLNLPSLVYAFALVVSIIAGSCLTVVGLLILSRWGK